MCVSLLINKCHLCTVECKALNVVYTSILLTTHIKGTKSGLRFKKYCTI